MKKHIDKDGNEWDASGFIELRPLSRKESKILSAPLHTPYTDALRKAFVLMMNDLGYELEGSVEFAWESLQKHLRDGAA